MPPAFTRAAAWSAGQWRRLLARIRRHPVRAALVPPVLLLAYLLVLIPLTPGISDLRKAKVEDPSVIVSADGVVLAEYKRINRQWVKLGEISPSVLAALIATEDHRFHEHHGLDLRRTVSALWQTLKGNRQGGSTITQQLARNLYPEEIGRAPTLSRKAKEAITALKIESIYSKEEILETYLNTVPFLYNAFGIEMAARTYYNPLRAGFLAVDPRNGHVKAWVGSRDFATEQFDHVNPTMVTHIEDRKGRTLAVFVAKPPEQVMQRAKAAQLVHVMRGVVDEGTGAAIRARYGIQADVAGKTGTTQDTSDGWFLMLHPHLVTGAWVGFNDNRVTMGDSWGQGARSALPMVGDFFQQALRVRAVDARAEFEIPRPRPKPREPEGDPVQVFVNDLLGRVFRLIQ